MTGYGNPLYARSLSEFGRPRMLPASRGWILERDIANSGFVDAIGCYPLFFCEDWGSLEDDLKKACGNLVSIALVCDPFGDFDEEMLRRCFGDIVTAFKDHFVVDLRKPIGTIVSKHHRYYARKALSVVTVERRDDMTVDEWYPLYRELIARHRLKGIQAFSRKAFETQLRIPGLAAFVATAAGRRVGAHIWYLQRDVGYSHLAAFTPLGYDVMASYALYWRALEELSGEVRWLDLGAGAGLDAAGQRGLSRFKKGWASETRTAFFCGKILNRTAYEDLAKKSGSTTTSFFPAYRKIEVSE